MEPDVPAQRRIAFTLNGRDVEVDCPDTEMLLDMLRVDFGLTGAKRSCDVQICGACTVLLDGRPVSACTTLAYEARGRRVETIEGMASGRQLHPLQQAFVDRGALQCGFCTPGMLLTAREFLERVRLPSRAEVVEALEGNICRCTGYFAIVDAVLAAAATAPDKYSADSSEGSH